MTMQQGPEAPGSLTVGAHLESAPNRLTLLLDIGMSNDPIGDDEIRRTASVSLPVHIDLNAMLVALSGLCPSCALTVKAEETHEGVELTIIPDDESNPTDIPVPVKPKSLRVFQNPPPSDGEGPPTEILLAMEAAGIHPIPLVAEFRDPEVVDALIALASHRHSVWPENPIGGRASNDSRFRLELRSGLHASWSVAKQVMVAADNGDILEVEVRTDPRDGEVQFYVAFRQEGKDTMEVAAIRGGEIEYPNTGEDCAHASDCK